MHIFLLGTGGTGESQLVKLIYNSIQKTLLYHCKDPDKPRVLLRGLTGISTLNIWVEPSFILVLELSQEQIYLT